MNSSRNSEAGGILRFIIWIAAVILSVFLIITFVMQRVSVTGSSMAPTLDEGDQVISDKLSYRFVDPERFDVIIFPYSYARDTYFIKRIIGLPGERVRIDAMGTIYINGEVLPEKYGSHISYAGMAAEEILLQEDEYFVLGDNRDESEDSRYADVGNVKRDQIQGKVSVRFWPLGRMGRIDSQDQ